MSRQRERIHKAVELRGFTVKSLEWKPPYDAGEKMGYAGGWDLTVDRPYRENLWPGDELCGMSTDELLADIDWSLRPPEQCDCPDRDAFPRTAGVKGNPERPLHEVGCRWRVDYHLRWWKREGRL